MQGKSLHEWWKDYKNGALGRDRLQNEIARALYFEPYRYGLRDEDEVGELYSRFAARIDALIDRFEDQGAPFEAYLASCLRYLGLSLRRIRTRTHDRTVIIEEEAGKMHSEMESLKGYSTWILDVCEPGPTFGNSAETVRSRLSMLCLKHAWVLDDSDIEYVARSGGMDSRLLLSKVAYVRRMSLIIKERFELRRTVREASWVRLRVLERRIRRESDQLRLDRLIAQLKRERSLFEGRKNAVRKTRILIPNSTVAKALGIPKGTVDAAIYHLRKRALLACSRERD